MTCPSCGGSTPELARFCPTCGHAMRVHADERRVVTVVFADMVGFTSLSESRDPEQVKNMVDRCFDRLATDVTGFGGRVDKVVGDAIIALFGAPVAHEDDAERAVRAALQMQRTLKSVADDIGLAVRLRVGVNTGEVVVGAVRAGGDYTAMGDVVNVASRLQSLAEAGDVVVGPETYACTSDVFRYEPLGMIRARGREEPLEAWVALEALAPPGRRPRRRQRVPLIGRDAELGLLRHALDLTTSRRRPHVLLLLGEAGVGKSRLAEEIAEASRCEHDALVLEGRCVPYGEANAWWPIAEAVRQLCEIGDDDDVETTLAKCRATMISATDQSPDDPEVERLSAGLLYLMGQEGALADVDPVRAAAEARRSVETVMRGVARQRPVVIVLSELHWADGAVLELVDELLGRSAQLPVMVLGTARPEIESRWNPKPGPYNVVTLHVDSLPRDAAEQLLEHLMEGPGPADLREALLERGGGNPFFLEELVSLLADAGLVKGEGVAPSRPSELPATLRGLVAARIDSLPMMSRATIEDAAVLGRSGRVDALDAMAAARGGTPNASDALDDLGARDLLAVDGGDWSFRSDLVREVAYDTLTKAERARRHFAVADWLSARRKELGREDEELEQIAHHFAAAAELVGELGGVDGVPADVRPRALRAIEKAAHRAKQRELGVVGVRLLGRALGLLDADDAVNRKRVLLARARALTSMRHLDDARRDIEAVMEDAAKDGDIAARATALTVLGDVQQKEGALQQSATTLEEAIGLWQQTDDERGRADALRILGMTQLFSGDPDGAEKPISEALDAFKRAGDRQGEAWAQQNLAWIAFVRGDLTVAEGRLDESALLFRAIGDRAGLSWALGLLAWVRYFQGRLAEAGELAERILRDADEAADRWAYAMTLTLLASVKLFAGDPESAVGPAGRAATSFRHLEDTDREHQARATEARALLALGRVDEAQQRVHDIVGRPGTGAFMGAQGLMAMLPLAVAVQCGEVDEAMPLLGLDHPRPVDGIGGDVIGQGERAALAGMALLQAGRVEEALTFLERGEAGAHTDGERANARACLALGLAAAGRPADAVAMAESVHQLSTGTYLDRAMADAARGLALVQQGDGAGAAALEAAVAAADATGDVLAQAVFRVALAHGLDALRSGDAPAALDDATARLERIGIRAPGWQRAFSTAAVGTATHR